MAEDWLADVRKYASNADETVVRAIERYLGIALRNRDSSLVSFSDSAETDRVRNNFLKKKLELTDADSVLDAAIAAVGERMKGDPTKNRVTVYYLLAEHFGKLGLFGGSGAAATTPAATPEPEDRGGGAAAAGVAAAGLAAGSASAAGEAAAAPVTPAAPVRAPAATVPSGTTATASDLRYSGDNVGGSSRFADVPEDDGSAGGGKWWLWLLLALALIALFFGLRSCMNQPAVINTSDETTINSTTDTTVATTTDAGNTLDGNATVPADVTTTTPAGAAVIAGTRAGLPMLTVYFDTGKAAVTKDFTAVAAPIKAYVAANPSAKLAVAGFNDASGNAAANAELSKNRAKAVQTALAAAGVPAGAVVLEKPADTTVGGTNDAAARRVEVTVKQ